MKIKNSLALSVLFILRQMPLTETLDFLLHLPNVITEISYKHHNGTLTTSPLPFIPLTNWFGMENVIL